MNFPSVVCWYTCNGNDAKVSDKIRIDAQTAENCNDVSSVTDAPDLLRNIKSYNHDAGRVNDDETVDERTKFNGLNR
jgi:hypothetical protein